MRERGREGGVWWQVNDLLLNSNNENTSPSPKPAPVEWNVDMTTLARHIQQPLPQTETIHDLRPCNSRRGTHRIWSGREASEPHRAPGDDVTRMRSIR